MSDMRRIRQAVLLCLRPRRIIPGMTRRACEHVDRSSMHPSFPRENSTTLSTLHKFGNKLDLEDLSSFTTIQAHTHTFISCYDLALHSRCPSSQAAFVPLPSTHARPTSFPAHNRHAQADGAPIYPGRECLLATEGQVHDSLQSASQRFIRDDTVTSRILGPGRGPLSCKTAAMLCWKLAFS